MELSNLVEEVFKQEGTAVKQLAERIKSKKTTLVEVVEALGPKLTSTNVQDRVAATDALASLFDALPKDFLSTNELEFIVEFLLNRLKDQHLVIPKAILCVHPIIQCAHLPEGAATKLLTQIFTEANVQSHVHKIRRTVFLIIAYMIRNKLNELKEMSTDFVINFLQAIDGEKDPRNLLLLFKIIPAVISNFDLGPFIEDFYEVLACYFPIDFTPTYSVPGSEMITRESLADALHTCLSQTAQFSSFLIPLALEKLDSNLTEAKVDSLRLLELCCERCYKPSDLEAFLPQIWHTLRREIFMAGNETVEKHSIDFLESAFRVVSSDESVLNTCVQMVFVECKHHLSEPELRLIHPTSKILVAMCNASEGSCKAVAPKVLGVIQDQLTQKTVGEEKKRLLSITQLILSSSRQYSHVNLSDWMPDWDQIVATWFTYLTSDDKEYANLCLKIFLRLLDNDVDFPSKSRHLLQEHLLALLANGILPSDSISAVVDVLEKLASDHAEELVACFTPTVLDWISTKLENSSDDKISAENSKRTLSYKVLGEISSNNVTVCNQVVSHLLSLIVKKEGFEPSTLKCLDRIVEKVSRIRDAEKLSETIDLLVKKLLVVEIIFEMVRRNTTSLKQTEFGSADGDDERCCGSKKSSCNRKVKGTNGNNETKDSCCGQNISHSDPTAEMNKEMLSVSAKIVRNLVRSCGVELQTNIVEKFWSVKVNGNPVGSVLTEIPLDLVEAMLGPLRPSVQIHRQNELAEYLLERSIRGNDIGNENCSRGESKIEKRLLAVLVNKLDPETEFLRFLGQIEESLDIQLNAVCHSPYDDNTNKDVDVQDKSSRGSIHLAGFEGVPKDRGECQGKNVDVTSGLRSSIELLAWITKALAMRGLKDLSVWVDKMINLLKRENVGTLAAEGFSILLADDEVSLNPQSHIKFRFLYKQRLFQMTVPKLVEGHREVHSEAAKVNFIQALSFQLKHIPKDILAMEMESVFPLLVASLKFNSSAPVVLSTLIAFTEMMNNSDEETEERLVEYFNDIVPELVKLAGFTESMDVRVLALKCLRRFAKCPSHVIVPIREKVIEDLQKTLDDSKRLVRKEAYLTRNIWILVGSPGGL